jgi:hypothetical protein
MILNKVITGFVIQRFDTETGKFIGQEFISCDDSQWENSETESPIDLTDEKYAEAVYGKGGVDEPYLNCDMVQPIQVEK